MPSRSPARLTYKEQHELEALPERIETLEAEQASLHTRLEDQDIFHRDAAGFQAIMARLPRLDAEIQAAYARWDDLERRQRESK